MNFVTPQTDPADAEPQKEERLKQIYDLSRFDADKDGSGCCEGCINMSEVKLAVSKASRSARDCNKWKSWLKRRLPIVDWLPNYKPKKYFVPDLMTGLTVGIMNIPQGLAYALLATLNPIYGLYVSFFPMIVYTLFGTCKHLIIGGVAIISLLTGTVIDEMVNEHFVRTNSSNSSTDEEHFRVEIACQLSLLVSLIHLFMGIIGLGFISAFFSDTFISGYTCGSAIHVVMSQLKDLFGIRKLTKYNGVFKIPKSLVDFLLKIHTSNWITLGFSIACVAFLVICKEFTNPLIKKRIHFEFPSELVLIIIMTSISYVADLKQNFNITIIENIPTGLPSPRVPQTTYLLPLLKDALLIASISFSVSISLAALYSRKKKYKIDPTQELYALGLSGFTGSFFSCYPIAGSLSRTSVVAESGGKTQLAAFFSSSVLVIVIIWLAPFLKTLPNLCLASVIIVALKGLLFQIRDLAPLWRINKYEFVTWLVTFLSVVLLDVDWGLFIGLGTSILVVIFRDQMAPLRPLIKPTNRMTLFREDFVRHDSDSDTQPIMRADKDIKVFKVEHSIYFANCKIFADNIYKLNQLKPSQHHVQPSVLHQKDKSAANDTANETEDYDELNPTNAGVNNLNHEMPSSSSPSPAHNGPELIVRRASLVSHDQNPIQSPADTSLMISHDFILDFSAVNYIDTNGIQVVEELIDDFKNIGVFVYICRPQESFLRMICRLKLVDKFDSHVFLTIEDAIRHFNEQTV